MGREILGVETVERGEILLHVCEKDRDVHDPIPRRPGVLEDGLDVLEDGADDGGYLVCANGEGFQLGQERVVDELQ